MDLVKYPFTVRKNNYEYEFFSEGPKGQILKLVRFTELGPSLYNLAFGDLDRTTDEICDRIVTDNQDSRRILATVAMIVYNFSAQHSGSFILATGTTDSRNRLYRIGITNNRHLIEPLFKIYGCSDGMWEPFQQNKTYQYFLVRRKLNT